MPRSQRSERTPNPLNKTLKINTQNLYIISRNFVEFGAFTANEITTFRKRSVLVDHDYVRPLSSNDWLPLGTWMAETAPTLAESKTLAKTVEKTVAKTAPRKRSASAAKSSKKTA